MKYFIVNNNYHDFSALQGDGVVLVDLTEGKPNIFHTERIKNEMLAKMRKHEMTKDDFIVVSGAGVLNALAAVAMKEVVGVLNVALYNSNDRSYKRRRNL